MEKNDEQQGKNALLRRMNLWVCLEMENPISMAYRENPWDITFFIGSYRENPWI